MSLRKIGKPTRGGDLNYRQPRFSSPLPFPSGIFELLPTSPHPPAFTIPVYACQSNCFSNENPKTNSLPANIT